MLTDLPLWQILSKHELSGRLIKWSIELSEFDLKYHPRSIIKSLILADFIAEYTLSEDDPKVAQDIPFEEPAEEPTLEMPPQTLYIDGSSTSLANGARIILISLEDSTLEYTLQFSFPSTNNEAEYEALIIDLKLAKELKTPTL